MNVAFRQLSIKDFELYKKMETQLEDDYMLHVFDRITSDGNALFGLFQDGELIAVAGYTLFAGQFAMMGRLRSDSRYRKNGFGTLITEYIYNEAKKHSGIKWIGANTEKHNTAAQKVLKKMEVPHITTLFAAQTDDLRPLAESETAGDWHKVDSADRKRQWMEQTYLNPDFDKSVFPLEAYYPLPADPSFFTDDRLNDWICYENKESDRAVFMWEEEKGKKYLHVVYPWTDFMTRPGLFTLLSEEFIKRKEAGDVEAVWMDLTKEEAALLPDNHPFDLPSPWMLHGHFVNRDNDEKVNQTDEIVHKQESTANSELTKSISQASQLLEDLENELQELDKTVDDQQSDIDSLNNRLNQVDSDQE